MKKVFLSSINKQHFLTIAYTAIIPLIIMFGGWTIICIIALICHRLASISFLWFSGTLFIGVLLLFLLFRWRCRLEVHEPNKTRPYALYLDCSDCISIKDALIQSLFMQALPTGEYFSFSKGKRNILFLLSHMNVQNKKECSKALEKSTNAARRIVGLKNEMSIAEIKNSCRINILLLDEITEDVFDQISVNAVYGMRYAEAVLNVYVDMKASILIIPSYISLWNGGSSKYCYCVKTLIDQIHIK